MYGSASFELAPNVIGVEFAIAACTWSKSIADRGWLGLKHSIDG